MNRAEGGMVLSLASSSVSQGSLLFPKNEFFFIKTDIRDLSFLYESAILFFFVFIIFHRKALNDK